MCGAAIISPRPMYIATWWIVEGSEVLSAQNSRSPGCSSDNAGCGPDVPLLGRGARQGDAGVGVRPLGQATAVEGVRAGRAPDVGHAEPAVGGGDRGGGDCVRRGDRAVGVDRATRGAHGAGEVGGRCRGCRRLVGAHDPAYLGVGVGEGAALGGEQSLHLDGGGLPRDLQADDLSRDGGVTDVEGAGLGQRGRRRLRNPALIGDDCVGEPVAVDGVGGALSGQQRRDHRGVAAGFVEGAGPVGDGLLGRGRAGLDRAELLVGSAALGDRDVELALGLVVALGRDLGLGAQPVDGLGQGGGAGFGGAEWVGGGGRHDAEGQRGGRHADECRDGTSESWHQFTELASPCSVATAR